MKRFDTHIGSIDSALEQRPEIFQVVSVDAAVHVPYSVINDLMQILSIKSLVSAHLIGEQGRSRFNVLANDGLQGSFSADQE